jgi:hypothetical protein
MQLKVSTVLTRLNLSELNELAEEVSAIAPDVWKIHQFRPRGEGRLNQSWLAIEESEFMDAVARLEVGAFPISASRLTDSIGAYLIVNPDSTLLVTQADHYLSFGRLIVDGEVQEDVFDTALRYLSPDKHIANSLKAFPQASYEETTAPIIASPLGRGLAPTWHFDRGGR